MVKLDEGTMRMCACQATFPDPGDLICCIVIPLMRSNYPQPVPGVNTLCDFGKDSWSVEKKEVDRRTRFVYKVIRGPSLGLFGGRYGFSPTVSLPPQR